MSIANQLIRKDGTALAEVKAKPRRVRGEVVDRDAIEIGELYEQARTSIVDSVRYQIECGQKLAEKKASMKHGEWLPWLEANAGVLRFASDRTAQMLMKAATENPQLTSDLAEEEAVKISRLTWGNKGEGNHRAQGTGENEWYTPDEYLDAARVVLGEIDLDPASSAAAQTKVRAAEYFSKATNGLERDWHGRVWLNPPYTQPDIALFASKMVTERRVGRVAAAVMLTHNYTDTAWFHELASEANAICFTRGRIPFYDAAGIVAAPTQGQAFFYFGQTIASFAEAFAKVGFIVEVRR